MGSIWWWLAPVLVAITAGIAVAMYFAFSQEKELDAGDTLAGAGTSTVEDKTIDVATPPLVVTGAEAVAYPGGAKPMIKGIILDLPTGSPTASLTGSSVRLGSGETRLYIGAPGAETGKGSLLIYTRASALVDFEAIPAVDFTPPEDVTGFGTSVDVTDDETLVFVSATGGADQGIFVYTRVNTTLTLLHRIPAGTPGQAFGAKLRVSADGNLLAATISTGMIVLYTRSGDTWVVQQVLIPSSTYTAFASGAHDAFDMDRRGLYIIGGSLADGKAWIFRRQGTSWSEQQTLTGTVPDPAFGVSAAFSNTSDLTSPAWEATVFLLAVGEFGKGTAPGSVHVYQCNARWERVATYTAPSVLGLDQFGSVVQWDPNAYVLAVAHASATEGQGTLGVTLLNYNFVAKQLALSSTLYPQTAGGDIIATATEDTRFGAAIAVARNTRTVCVGAPWRLDSAVKAGVVFTFHQE